ncbi:hypothetical protein ALC57_00504 [Trachymyrmex cornetzi]|uniref:Uncharacterized protein n=1 Tax=Trachymyrmex cornetzi TaxID=471704 RepID=A0A151JSE1_9HYME|nr:hypothetical protein ALC57_00504 [Trachymyrmex cornetzi]
MGSRLNIKLAASVDMAEFSTGKWLLVEIYGDTLVHRLRYPFSRAVRVLQDGFAIEARFITAIPAAHCVIRADLAAAPVAESARDLSSPRIEEPSDTAAYLAGGPAL